MLPSYFKNIIPHVTMKCYSKANYSSSDDKYFKHLDTVIFNVFTNDLEDDYIRPTNRTTKHDDLHDSMDSAINAMHLET